MACEQAVYMKNDNDGKRPISLKNPRPRFKNEEERIEHRRRIARKHCAELINANCTPNGYYCTLTFDSEHELHEYDSARKERNNLRRRIMRRCPNAILFIFMGKGENTSRIHFHMIAENVTPEAITAAWSGGEVTRIEHLREHNYTEKGLDLGADFTAVANYCFDHWKIEQGTGHYYCTAGDIKQPEEEPATLCKEYYDENHPPRPPKGYIYTGQCYKTKYGYMSFHYVVDTSLKTSDTLSEERNIKNVEQRNRNIVERRNRNNKHNTKRKRQGKND